MSLGKGTVPLETGTLGADHFTSEWGGGGVWVIWSSHEYFIFSGTMIKNNRFYFFFGFKNYVTY